MLETQLNGCAVATVTTLNRRRVQAPVAPTTSRSMNRNVIKEGNLKQKSHFLRRKINLNC